ncbi:hypothetical protein GHK45_23360 [Sinorhizobium meliloti]|uniref:Uncharacterized protein n=1 Tax=Rhizobium meliloti TaxID=382 RepID=A0A6A7ZV38_RHIML|nr:hypothetical protein [Sinorhizobium meliloti]MQW06554.1 hypothetical protein [Sinorhizobium meliloti]
MSIKQDAVADNKVAEFPHTESAAVADIVHDDAYFRERRAEYELRQAEIRKTMSMALVLGLIFTALFWISFHNPEIYLVKAETLTIINSGYNAIILLTIPFLLGVVGAISRLLLSGVRVIQEVSLVIGSGLMAAFSWVGIKSGVLMAVIAPHLEKQGLAEPAQISSSPSDFYTLMLVAVFVGMFSTNLYLFISQRVDQLSQKASDKRR